MCSCDLKKHMCTTLCQKSPHQNSALIFSSAGLPPQRGDGRMDGVLKTHGIRMKLYLQDHPRVIDKFEGFHYTEVE